MIVTIDSFLKAHLPLKTPIDASISFFILQIFKIELNTSTKGLDFMRIAHVLIIYFIQLNFIPKVKGLQFLRSLHLVQFEG